MTDVSPDRIEKLSSLQETLGHEFVDLKLLNKSLTHKSYVNERNELVKHNERFEFLGDSVLDILVSDYLVDKYKDYAEGTLSKIRAAVVNESCLAGLARQLNLGEYLLLGKGEHLSGGRDKSSILANAFEALVGALFKDGGLESTSKVFLPLLKFEIEKFADSWSFRDYKSDLQEITQNKLVCTPSYKVVNELGPDHAKEFEVVVMIKSKIMGNGLGKSKKEAEQAAAKIAMESFTNESNI
ncbi:MAG: ribonuclease III [Nitrospinaceae bacterium]|jgi:ribonuclease III|nr:ribonuclease III [Nitrospina sp.]MBT5376267.1 ribonuclease III [Nitrospinaceae bacterium]MBT5869037.1 ribonuclease III [Nitrospinaceae bacterium]MBT6347456.1 ribonuclease III [Nitrospina sp.]